MRYKDVPNLDQWKSDTSNGGDRGILAPLDDALASWQRYTAQNKVNKDTELWILALLRYGAHWLAVAPVVPEPPREPLDALREVATLRLAGLCPPCKGVTSRFKVEQLVDEMVRRAFQTGMSEGGKITDSQTRDLQYAKDQERWKYEVYCESGRLVQFPWWKWRDGEEPLKDPKEIDDPRDPSRKITITESTRLPVCTMKRSVVALKDGRVLQPDGDYRSRKKYKGITDPDELVWFNLIDCIDHEEAEALLGRQNFRVFAKPLKGAFAWNLDKDYIDVVDPHMEPGQEIGLYVRIYTTENDKEVVFARYNHNRMPDGIAAEAFLDGLQKAGLKWSKVEGRRFDGLAKKWFREVELQREEGLWDVVGNKDHEDKQHRLPTASCDLGWEAGARYGTVCGVNWGGYVLGTDAKLYMRNHAEGGLFHSYYFSGRPIICAGSLMVDGAGKLLAVSNLSGHYRPHADTIYCLLHFLRFKGVDLSNVIVVAFRGGSPKEQENFDFYLAGAVLKAGTTVGLKPSLDRTEVAEALGKHQVFRPDTRSLVALSTLPELGYLGLVDAIMKPL